MDNVSVPREKEPAYVNEFDSPAGPLLCAVDGDGRLLLLWFCKGEECRQVLLTRLRRRGYEPLEGGESEGCRRLKTQLDEYFSRRRRDFDFEVKPDGTDFQREVWQMMLSIPYASTMSYGELAGAIGRPKASRAVGRASALNPIALVIPCHRVLGVSGSLTGYGGGMPLKRSLLALEQGQSGLFEDEPEL